MNGLGLLSGLQGLPPNMQISQLQQLQQMSGLTQGMGQQLPQSGSMPNMGMGGMNMPFPYNFYGQGMPGNTQNQAESPEKKLYDMMRLMQMQQQSQEPQEKQAKQEEP